MSTSQTHNCDLCLGTNHKPIEAARPYIGGQEPPVVCSECGFVYVRSRRSPAEIASSWSTIWGEGYTSSWPAVKARLTYVAEYMAQNIGGQNHWLLDIGAGEGDFMKVVDGSQFIPFGLEPSEKNVKKINDMRLPCHQGTIESFNPGRTYDAVTLLWTLENTGDCMGVLRKARTLLKKGGRIVVATGSRILVPYKKPLSTYFSSNQQDLHCFRFSANSLTHALAAVGFSDIRLNKYMDSDWLVAIGTAGTAEDMAPFKKDNPANVLKFFEDWARMWP